MVSCGTVEISRDPTGAIDSPSNVRALRSWGKVDGREDSVGIMESLKNSAVGEEANNLTVDVNAQGHGYKISTSGYSSLGVIERSEGASAVKEPANSPHRWKGHGTNNLAVVVDAGGLGTIGTWEIDDGEHPATVKVTMGSSAGVEVADNLPGPIDADGSGGSAVCGARAGDINRGEDPIVIQKPVSSGAIAIAADDQAGVVDAEGRCINRTGNIDGGENLAPIQEPMPAPVEVADNVTGSIDAGDAGIPATGSGGVIDDGESVFHRENWPLRRKGGNRQDDEENTEQGLHCDTPFGACA